MMKRILVSAILLLILSLLFFGRGEKTKPRPIHEIEARKEIVMAPMSSAFFVATAR